MKSWLKKIEESADFLRKNGITSAKAGIVLGTGLGQFIDHLNIKKSIPYQEIPHFPQATVESHKGQLIYGEINNIHVIAMQGRFHYYEGYSMQEITFPIRVMKALGIQYLLLSNAAGGINLHYRKGDLVILEDHIHLQPDNPLRGMNDAAFGPRFPDMSCPYDKKLNEKLKAKAVQLNMPVKSGIYVSVMGPNLETRAEYKFLKMIGADMVGMSTVPEVVVANQLGLPCAAVSVITDECDPDNLQPVNIADIIEVAGKADEKLSRLFADVIANL